MKNVTKPMSEQDLRGAKTMSEQDLHSWWKSEKSKVITEVEKDIQLLEDVKSDGMIAFIFSDPNPMGLLMAAINSCSNPKNRKTSNLRTRLGTASQVLNIPLVEIEAEILRRRTGLINSSEQKGPSKRYSFS